MILDSKPWALVTGASSGLGIEFARQLAKRHHNLILVARSRRPMELLAEELRATHDIDVLVEELDLAVAGSAGKLDEALRERHIIPEVLVNNAAVGFHGPFLDQDPDSLRRMLQLDLITLTELTHIFACRMAERGTGRILLVGSMAAYQPVPLFTVYAAAKAYVLSLGESLNVELAPDIMVTVLSPGVMETGFNEQSGYVMPSSLKPMLLAPEVVASIGLKALFSGRSGVIAGRLNKLMALASRLMPRHFAAKQFFRQS